MCLCLPLGIAGLIFSLQVNSKADAGDLVGAQDASRKARLFNLIGTIGGAVILVAYIIVIVVGGAESTTTGG